MPSCGLPRAKFSFGAGSLAGLIHTLRVYFRRFNKKLDPYYATYASTQIEKRPFNSPDGCHSAFPTPEGRSGQQTIDLLTKRICALGAVQVGTFVVDCDTHVITTPMNQQKILHVMHNSEQPATVFSILETENKRICVTADTLFDMITGKISELSGAKKAPKAESRGTRFEVAGGDFLIKLGSVTVGQNFKGILCEVEYQPCVIPSNCWELMREFLQGSFGSCVSSQPPAFLQSRFNEIYTARDTILQYLEQFQLARKVTGIR